MLILLLLLTLALAGCSATIAETDLPAPGSTGLYEVARSGESITVIGPVPTPTVTATVTLTPAPAPTVTVTAIPSPIVSEIPTPNPAPTYTTMKDARLVSGRVYEHVVFTGGSSTRGVLHMNYSLSNVTLRDCIIESGPQNGWTINAKDGVIIEGIRAERLTIRPQPRMGIEFTDRTTTGRKSANWRCIDLIDVTVDPQGAEAVSFCGDVSGVDLYVRDMLIRGSGNRPDLYPWGQGFEINKARGITVDGLTIRQTRGAAFNLQGPNSSTLMDWSFRNVTADMRVKDPDQTQPMSSSSQVVYCKNVGGGWTFSGLVVGTTSDCGYLDNVRGADFTGTTWVREGGTARVTRVNCTGNIGLP